MDHVRKLGPRRLQRLQKPRTSNTFLNPWGMDNPMDPPMDRHPYLGSEVMDNFLMGFLMFSRISHHPRGEEKTRGKEKTRGEEGGAEGGAEKCDDVAFEKLFSVNSVYTNPRALWGCLHSDMFFLFHGTARHQADRARSEREKRAFTWPWCRSAGWCPGLFGNPYWMVTFRIFQVEYEKSV